MTYRKSCQPYRKALGGVSRNCFSGSADREITLFQLTPELPGWMWCFPLFYLCVPVKLALASFSDISVTLPFDTMRDHCQSQGLALTFQGIVCCWHGNPAYKIDTCLLLGVSRLKEEVEFMLMFLTVLIPQTISSPGNTKRLLEFLEVQNCSSHDCGNICHIVLTQIMNLKCALTVF